MHILFPWIKAVIYSTKLLNFVWEKKNIYVVLELELSIKLGKDIKIYTSNLWYDKLQPVSSFLCSRLLNVQHFKLNLLLRKLINTASAVCTQAFRKSELIALYELPGFNTYAANFK